MVKEIINNAMIMVQEYDVKNPRTYVAHRSKVCLAKKMGQKDVNPLFKLPRLTAEAIRDLAEELSQFELPARQLDADLVDEFHSHDSEIHHRGRDHCSSISSEPPVIPQNLSGSSIAASSESSENVQFQSFAQSPGSTRSSSSNPEELFDEHFQIGDEMLDEMLRDSPAEDDGITGSAANLTPEPEPEKTPEPRENVMEPTEINIPAREQEERLISVGREIPREINTPHPKLTKQQSPRMMRKD